MTDDPIDMVLVACLDAPPDEVAARIARECDRQPEIAGELRRRFARLVSTGLVHAPDRPWQRIGPYRLLERLGGGGMGDVYLADQDGLERKVALKLMRPGHAASSTARERFRREIDAISRLDHPGICPVFDAGAIDGVPFLAMRYVDGETLAARIERLKATPRGSTESRRALVETHVALIEKVARAAHAAHASGLVHRDVKPGNVIVTRGGEPVLVDFGLARLDEAADGELTVSGDRVGTPAYMAPEQVLGQHVDRRTDVYALGVTLYELLTLRVPFAAPRREDLYRAILAGEHTRASRLEPRIPGDLEVVLETALDRDPDRRYQTALDLAEDLRRVRAREVVAARPLPLALRARRWTERHPTAATALALMAVGLGVAIATAVWIQARLVQTRAIGLAKAAGDELGRDPALALRLALAGVGLRETPDTVSQLHRVLAFAHEAHRLELADAVECVAFAPDGSRVAVGTSAGREPAGRVVLWSPSTGATEAWVAHAAGVTSVAFDPRGERLLTSSRNGEVVEWRLDASRARRVLWQGDHPIAEARYAAPGTFLLAEGTQQDYGDVPQAYVLQIRSIDGAEVLWSATVSSVVERADATVDGRFVAVACGDGRARVFDTTRGDEPVAEVPASFAAQSVRLTPDGLGLAVGALDGTVTITRFDDGRVTRLPRAFGVVTDVAFSPDGTRIATASVDRRIRVFDAADGELLLTFGGHRRDVRSLCFDAAGDRLASVSNDGTVRLWDLSVPAAPALVGHRAAVFSVRFDADGVRILSGGHDGTARLWDLAGHELIEPLRGVSWLTVDFASDGRLIIGDAGRFQKEPETSTVGIWTADGRRRELLLERVGATALRTVAASPDGQWLLTASALGGARLYRIDGSGHRVLAAAGAKSRAKSGATTSASFVRDGTRALVTHWRPGDIEVWSVGADTEEPEVHIECGDDTWFAEFSPDGRTVASAHASGLVRIWDLAHPTEPVRTWAAHSSAPVVRVRFAPDGSGFLTASWDGTARLWQRDGRLVATLAGHEGGLWDAVFSPDGARIATASSDGKIRVWWARTGDLLAAACGRAGELTAEELGTYRDLLGR